MRRLVISIFCLMLAVPAFASAPADRALISIDNPELETAARLLSTGVMVVRDMERYLLVVAGPEETARMDGMGIEWVTLDASMEGKEYFTVGVRDRDRLSVLESGTRVLRYDGFDAVVEATEDEIRSVAEEGFEVARVFVRPIRVPRAEKPAVRPATKQADPEIQAMVDAVSSATIDAHVQRLQNFVTRYATHDSCQAAANWIKAQFESYGIDSVYFHNFSTTYKDNVVAVIPGSGDPSRIVVLGGHYDSITSNHNNCPGADDNASGAACALECARILSAHQFNYTLVFIAFCAEELGLYGSEGYAADAAARGDDIIGMIAVDMIGYRAAGDALDLDIIFNTNSQWMRDLVGDVAGLYVPTLPVVDGYLPGGASSDHASFWAHGYDAILFFEDSGNYSPYIHTTSDVVGLSYNSPTLAERCVKAAVAFLATAAERFTVAIIHTPLENTEDTTDPYRVVASIVAAGTLNPDSLLVRYSTGTGDETLPMSPTGNPDEYEAYIPAQPGGTFVDYYIVAEDTEGNRALDPKNAPAEVHTFFVGTISAFFVDDFESDKGWIVGAAGDNATTGVWERCDPEWTEAQPEDDHTPDPGIRAYITQCAAGTSQGSYDVDGGRTTLLSPVFDVSAYPNVRVRYSYWYVNDTGSAPGTDYWRVHVTGDGWATWDTLQTTTASTHAWEMAEFNLGDYVNLADPIQFRFIAADEGDGSIVEAGVDDFSLVTYQEAPTVVADGGTVAEGRISLGQNVPNPFNPQTTIHFTVPAAGARATLRIFDVAGRQVATLLDHALVAGDQAVRWDGKDGHGVEVSTGVYFYRLDAGERSLTRKMVLIR